MNLKILNELALTKKETDDMMRKLRDYIYVDEMNDLKYGFLYSVDTDRRPRKHKFIKRCVVLRSKNNGRGGILCM